MPKKPGPYAEQPAVAAILKLISRKRGATIAEIAESRDVEQHTVRAILSRLGSQSKIKFDRTADAKRGLVYRVQR